MSRKIYLKNSKKNKRTKNNEVVDSIIYSGAIKDFKDKQSTYITKIDRELNNSASTSNSKEQAAELDKISYQSH